MSRVLVAIGICLGLLTMNGGERVSSSQERRVIQGVAGSAASPAVVAGGLVFASVISGVGEDGRPAGDDVAAQSRSVLDRLRRVLENAGSSMAQAVSVSVYLRQAADFEAMNGVYRTYFSEAPPTRTTVVAGLPRGALVAMSAIAAANGQPREVLHPAGWMKSPRPYLVHRAHRQPRVSLGTREPQGD